MSTMELSSIFSNAKSKAQIATLALTPSKETLKLISKNNLKMLQEKEKVILNPRFPYSPHCNVEQIKALRR
jgi:hypothetical protein